MSLLLDDELCLQEFSDLLYDMKDILEMLERVNSTIESIRKRVHSTVGENVLWYITNEILNTSSLSICDFRYCILNIKKYIYRYSKDATKEKT